MSDRELLEMAAKAAGIQLRTGSIGRIAFFYVDKHDDEPDEIVPWNPLTDDGDALRLAVKLNMTLAVGAARGDEGECCEFALSDGDPYAAARRAIVRAAASIGAQLCRT